MTAASQRTADSAEPIIRSAADLQPVDALAERLVARMTDMGLRVATAESCTAGRLAATLALPPGASDVLFGGIVAYTKEAKTRLLGVHADLLAARSAVAAEVAIAMARGACSRAGCELGIALTGITGPTCDEDGNPRGRVFVAAAAGSETLVRHCEFGDLPPEALIDASLRVALSLGLEAAG